MKTKVVLFLFLAVICYRLDAQPEQYSCIDSSQDKEFVMYRGKTGYVVNKWDYLEIYMKKKETPGFRVCCPETFKGYYMGYDRKALWLDLRTHKASTLDSAGVSNYCITHYGIFSDSYTTNCTALLPGDIDRIEYSSHFRTWWNEASVVLLALSGASALIGAPIAAMEGWGERFNYVKYQRWAGWSMAAFGASLAINIGTQPRRYYMTPR
jgi:hypothetical protein